MIKVSVIIPVYQAEKFIRTCVQSVLSQTYREIELVLVDDGSQDHSLEICNEFAETDSRIKVIHQENRGVSVARNRGLEEATGDYILFVDADDLIEKNMIEYMVKRVSQGCHDIVICGFDYVYSDRIETQIPQMGEGNYKKEYVYANFGELYRQGILHNIGTKLYSVQLLKQNHIRFDEKRTVLEDIQFCLEAIKCADHIYICTANFYKYIMQANQSSIQKTYRKNYYLNLQDFFRFIENLGIKKDKDFYLIYMDAILLTLVNELYNDRKRVGNIIKEYKNICCLDYVKESSQYILKEDVRLSKYLFYKVIWKKWTHILFIMIFVWHLGSR